MSNDTKENSPVTQAPKPAQKTVAPQAPATTEAPKAEAKAQAPTVGRIVHYYTTEGEQRAGIISDMDGASVTLHLLNSLGVVISHDVPFAPVPTPAHWSWPTVN